MLSSGFVRTGLQSEGALHVRFCFAIAQSDHSVHSQLHNSVTQWAPVEGFPSFVLHLLISLHSLNTWFDTPCAPGISTILLLFISPFTHLGYQALQSQLGPQLDTCPVISLGASLIVEIKPIMATRTIITNILCK